VMRRVGVGDPLIPAHPRYPRRRRVEGALKARCIVANAVSWPSTSRLQQTVRVSVLLTYICSFTGR
jgi:hypothetical protein